MSYLSRNILIEYFRLVFVNTALSLPSGESILLGCSPSLTLKTEGPESPSSVTHTVPEAGLLRPRMWRPSARLIVTFLEADKLWIWFSEVSQTRAEKLLKMESYKSTRVATYFQGWPRLSGSSGGVGWLGSDPSYVANTHTFVYLSLGHVQIKNVSEMK